MCHLIQASDRHGLIQQGSWTLLHCSWCTPTQTRQITGISFVINDNQTDSFRGNVNCSPITITTIIRNLPAGDPDIGRRQVGFVTPSRTSHRCGRYIMPSKTMANGVSAVKVKSRSSSTSPSSSAPPSDHEEESSDSEKPNLDQVTTTLLCKAKR